MSLIDWELLYQRHQGVKYDLARIARFADEIGNPQHQYQTIHVVGTNGKGSTSSFIQRLIHNSGNRCGLYTSPHLYHPRERIRIDDELISEEYIKSWLDAHYARICHYQLSYFEIMTALAFNYFADRKCSWAVIEAGLGGRLDATNLLKPKCVVMTSISLDHQEILGETIYQIIHEKSAVIKPYCSVVVAPQPFSSEVRSIVFNKTRQQEASFHAIAEETSIAESKSGWEGSTFNLNWANCNLIQLEITLRGSWQIENAVTAVIAASLSLEDVQSLDENTVRKSLKETQWPGRLETISTDPLVIADVSHNEDGLSKTLNFIAQNRKTLPYPPAIIFSTLKRKNFTRMFEQLEQYDFPVWLYPMKTQEGLTLRELLLQAEKNSTQWQIIDSIDPSVLNQFSKNSLFIIGSHYLLAEWVPLIRRRVIDSK